MGEAEKGLVGISWVIFDGQNNELEMKTNLGKSLKSLGRRGEVVESAGWRWRRWRRVEWRSGAGRESEAYLPLLPPKASHRPDSLNSTQLAL